jgi:hypothetical protein
VHPPVVPYGARATWHLYAGERNKDQREKLLGLLGKHDAVVLGGHLHKYASLTRTVGRGQFHQLAVSSIVSAPNQKIKDELRGISAYTGNQVNLEPKHAPETAAERRALYDLERPSVIAFDYADAAGFAVVTVEGPFLKAHIHSGTSPTAFTSTWLSG